MSDSLPPYGLYPAKLLRPWDSPGKNSGVGCHFLLQGIFPTQGIEPRSPALQADSLPAEPQGKLCIISTPQMFSVIIRESNMSIHITWCKKLSSFKSWKMMLWKCCTQYASKFGKLSSGHRNGKGQCSFQSQRKAMPKNAQTTTQWHSSHMLVK